MTQKMIGKGGKKRKKSKGQNDSSEKPSKEQQNTTHNVTLTTNNNDINVNKNHTTINSSKSESVKPGTMNSFIPNNKSPIVQQGRQNSLQFPMQQIPNPNITKYSPTAGYYSCPPTNISNMQPVMNSIMNESRNRHKLQN